MALPYETEPACKTSQPWVRWEWVTSQTSRDFPTPGSPTMATTWPCPLRRAAERLAELLELPVPAHEPGQPPRRRRGSRERRGPRPVSS